MEPIRMSGVYDYRRVKLIGNIYVTAGRFKEAEEFYRKAISETKKKGDSVDYFEDLEQWRIQKEKIYMPYRYLGRLYDYMGEYEKANVVYEIWHTNEPNMYSAPGDEYDYTHAYGWHDRAEAILKDKYIPFTKKRIEKAGYCEKRSMDMCPTFLS